MDDERKRDIGQVIELRSIAIPAGIEVHGLKDLKDFIECAGVRRIVETFNSGSCLLTGLLKQVGDFNERSAPMSPFSRWSESNQQAQGRTTHLS